VNSRVAVAVASSLLMVLAAAGCRTTPSQPEQTPEDQLFAARQEYRQTLDGLYRAYGGTTVLGNPAPDSSGDGNVVGHVVGEADRSYFERQCLAVGRGERPFSISSKMQRFLDVGENANGCRKAAQLQVRIRELEERIGK
jgi:hypothetical protein